MRTDAPSNTEGGKQGFVGSASKPDSREHELGEKNDMMASDLDVDAGKGGVAGRKELRVQLERLEELERCEEELSRFDELSDDGSVDSFISIDSDRTNKRRRHSSSDEEGRASASTSKKKGRGRPPTTGHYIGLAEAKRQLVLAEKKEMELRAERELAELTRDLRTPALSESSGSVNPSPFRPFMSSRALGENINKALETIMGVRNKSKNLSGPMMKALGDASASIQESVERLMEKTSTTEILALRKEKADLAREMAVLREDHEALKKELAAASLLTRKLETELQLSREKPAPPPSNMEEVIKRAVAEAVAVTNARMSARFEGLESRLLPAPRLRPPLAADDHAAQTIPDVTPPAAKMPTPRTSPEVSTLMPSANSARTTAPKKGRQTKEKAKASERKKEVAPSKKKEDKENSTGDEKWETVTSKKRRKNGSQKEPKKKTAPAQRAPTKPRPPKLRAPTSSAVVMQLTPEATARGMSYADVLLRAKERVNLTEHGIPAPQFKASATGARMLILPGSETAEKADTLARLIKEAVGDDVVKVSRPVKCVGVRITGLDDCSRKECVVAAIAEAGSVPPERIRCGEVSRSAGLGTVVVQCPIEAAKRLVEKGRLTVGWVSARVRLLDARPLRCYKCLEAGHTAALCASKTDRSGLCFRCGEEGHKANACVAEAPKCAVCAAAGKSASHKLGGGACVAPTRPRTRGGKKKKSGDGPRALSSTSSPAAGVSNAAGANAPRDEEMATDECPTDMGSAGGAPPSGTRS